MTRGQLIAAIIVGLAALLLGLFAGPKQAKAHQSPKGWTYPSDCCRKDGKECHRVEPGAIAVTAAGYKYRDKEFAFGGPGIRLSGDGDWHACEKQIVMSHGGIDWVVYCVIVPEGGMG